MMDLETFLRAHGIAATERNARAVHRVREAGVYLRARAYRVWHRSGCSPQGVAAFQSRCRQVADFEARRIAGAVQ